MGQYTCFIDGQYWVKSKNRIYPDSIGGLLALILACFQIVFEVKGHTEEKPAARPIFESPLLKVFEITGLDVTVKGGAGAPTVSYEIPISLEEMQRYPSMTVSAKVQSSGTFTWMKLTLGRSTSFSALPAPSEIGKTSILSVTAIKPKDGTENSALFLSLQTQESSAHFSQIRVLLYGDEIATMNSPPENKRSYVIGFIGHSTTAGYQTSPEHSIPQLLQYKLDTYYPGYFRVINLGRPSGTLFNEILQFTVDCVIPHWKAPGMANSSVANFISSIFECRISGDSKARVWENYNLNHIILAPMWNDTLSHVEGQGTQSYLDGETFEKHLMVAAVAYQRNGDKRPLHALGERINQQPVLRRVPGEPEAYKFGVNVLYQLIEIFFNEASRRGIGLTLVQFPQSCGNRLDYCSLFGFNQYRLNLMRLVERAHREAMSNLATDKSLVFIDCATQYDSLIDDERLSPKKISDMTFFPSFESGDLVHLAERGNQFIADNIFSNMQDKFESKLK